MSEQFYANLKPFTNFNEVFDKNHYVSAPKDWFVIVTDIVNSTIAVEEGKYKDVNLIGSACIGAVTSLGNFPFVFGGDGASFLVPPSKIEIVKDALIKVKNSAKKRYSLKLRIGVISVEKVLQEKELKVAKFMLAKDRYVAKFSGGGLELADKLIKNDDSYQLKSNTEKESSFDGISCRWNPIKSSQGVILTLIIKAKNFKQYKDVQSKINKILGKDLNKINPVKTNEMSYMGLFDIYKNEKKYEASFFSLSSIKRKLEIFFAYLIFKTFRSFQPKFLSQYTSSMQNHSDFRKFDDVLRMVIDCSEVQMNEIIETLNEDKSLDYGYSHSDEALMTCLVFGLDEGEHIHFIDGADGGYTKAAKMLKSVRNV